MNKSLSIFWRILCISFLQGKKKKVATEQSGLRDRQNKRLMLAGERVKLIGSLERMNENENTFVFMKK